MTKKQTALDAFIGKKAEFDTLIERLQNLSSDHFGAEAGKVNWGDVGTLTHRVELLKTILGENN